MVSAKRINISAIDVLYFEIVCDLLYFVFECSGWLLIVNAHIISLFKRKSKIRNDYCFCFASVFCFIVFAFIYHVYPI